MRRFPKTFLTENSFSSAAGLGTARGGGPGSQGIQAKGAKGQAPWVLGAPNGVGFLLCFQRGMRGGRFKISERKAPTCMSPLAHEPCVLSRGQGGQGDQGSNTRLGNLNGFYRVSPAAHWKAWCSWTLCVQRAAKRLNQMQEAENRQGRPAWSREGLPSSSRRAA